MKRVKTPPPFPRQSFEQVLRELERRDLIKCAVDVTDKCYVAGANDSWLRIAQTASSFSNGQWYAVKDGLRWRNSQKCFYLKSWDAIEEIMRLRAITRDLVGKEPNYSSGACARAILEWAFLQAPKQERDSAMLNGDFIGYHECRPGKFKEAILWDMAGCYFQLISRLQEPRCGIDFKGRIEWFPLSRNERTKWEHAKLVMSNEKLLRNSVWGAMLGGTDRQCYFKAGKLERSQGYEGHSYAAAALVGRSAWELCRNAAEDTDAVYAQTDGIIALNGAIPRYWEFYGMKYTAKAHGRAHIVGQHRYWVESAPPTKVYNPYDEFHETNLRKPAPDTQYHMMWL